MSRVKGDKCHYCTRRRPSSRTTFLHLYVLGKKLRLGYLTDTPGTTLRKTQRDTKTLTRNGILSCHLTQED